MVAVRSGGRNVPEEAWNHAEQLWASSNQGLTNLKFAEMEYELDGGSVLLHNGVFKQRDSNGFTDVRLEHVWQFDLQEGQPHHSLVFLDHVTGQASSLANGRLLVFGVRDGHPAVVQRLSFDRQAPGTGASFDIASGRLVVKARSDDDSPHCCPENLDIVTYQWGGEQFEQVSTRVEPIKNGRYLGPQK
jgi:hypothetical protein